MFCDCIPEIYSSYILMIYILLLLVLIIILFLIYYFNRNNIKNSKESFTNFNSIKQIILNNNKFLGKNLGVLTYNGSIFETPNKHHFVFRQNNNKLNYFGDSISNFPTEDISSSTKLYQNHESFCLLSDGNIRCFGNPTFGGNIPTEIQTELSSKTIVNVYSTNSAYTALTSDKNIYCWGNSIEGGLIPSMITSLLRNNVEQVFSNKNTFLVIYSSERKILSWGTIPLPSSLNELRNVSNVYSNDNSFIVIYDMEIDGNIQKKIKCFTNHPKYILNKNLVENLTLAKCVYANSESFIVIHGTNNNVEICGNTQYLGDLVTQKSSLSHIIHVETNNGAYCLLDVNGNIYTFGHNDYVVSAPSTNLRTNIKKLYSNYGCFIAVNNDDTAFVWGLQTHGYVANNKEIINVKDVYVNGDSEGGAILFVKKNNDNVICLGNSNYGGNSILSISSSSIENVFSNTFRFFYTNSDNRIRIIGNKSLGNYNSSTTYVKDDSNIYINNNNILKYNSYISGLSKIIDYTNAPATSTTSSLASLESLDSLSSFDSSVFDSLSANYYIWRLNGDLGSVSNNIPSWDIVDTNNITYTNLDKIMAVINNSQRTINFKNKVLVGGLFSISFNLMIPGDLSNSFIIFKLLNVKLEHDNGTLKLYYNDIHVRSLNINSNPNIITLTFEHNKIKVFKNTSEITYGNNVNYTLPSDLNTNLKFGDDENGDTSFYISDLLVMENYVLNNSDVNHINISLDSFIENFNLVPTTQSEIVTTQSPEIMTTSSTLVYGTTAVIDEELVTRPIFERQNYLTMAPKTSSLNIKLKTKTSDNVTFIVGQTEANLVKMDEFKEKLATENISYFIKNFITISKVENIIYRGLVFNNKTYEEELDGKMYYIFGVNNEALLNFIKLKYLDIEQINRIYRNFSKYGDVLIFISGTKTLKTDPIYQIKNNIYMIIYKDKDNISRFQQIKVDLKYFYEVLNYEFMELFINQNLPSELSLDLYEEFYNNLEDNVGKNYENILINEESDTIIDSIVVNVFKNKKRDQVLNIYNDIQKANNRCTFIPSGNTLFECRQLCSNDTNLNCSDTQCNNICNNCYSEACKWNYNKKINNNKLRPSKSKIKGFKGNKFVKITWIKPESKSEIIKYYIVVTTPTINDFIEIYSFYDPSELLEYMVKNLENGIPYRVSVISKNKMGVSDISNIETIVPSEFSELDDYEQTNTFDNSLQNMKFNQNVLEGIDLNKQKSIYEKQVIINELKDILVNKLKINSPLGVYNVNIF